MSMHLPIRGAAAALLLATTLAATPADAAWLGLEDGEYDLTLAGCGALCDPSPAGRLTIAGTEATYLRIAIDGVLFEGNPNDYVTNPGGALRSDLDRVSYAPLYYTFFSLLQLTSGENLFIYCRDESPGEFGGQPVPACRPDTLGSWRAEPLPEPGTLGLALAATAAGFAAVRIRRRR
jgi:hypothetical protein